MRLPPSPFRPVALAAGLLLAGLAVPLLSACGGADEADDRQGKVPLEIVEEHPVPSPSAEEPPAEPPPG